MPQLESFSLTRACQVSSACFCKAQESDPAKRNETGAADGFLEVVEGWALPSHEPCCLTSVCATHLLPRRSQSGQHGL